MTFELDKPHSVDFKVHRSRSEGFEKVTLSFVFAISHVTNKFRNIQASPNHKTAYEKCTVQHPRKCNKDQVHYGGGIFFKQKALHQGVLTTLKELTNIYHHS